MKFEFVDVGEGGLQQVGVAAVAVHGDVAAGGRAEGCDLAEVFVQGGFAAAEDDFVGQAVALGQAVKDAFDLAEWEQACAHVALAFVVAVGAGGCAFAGEQKADFEGHGRAPLVWSATLGK